MGRRIALGAALALTLGGCSTGPETEPPPAPLLIVGLDGFEWRVALPMMRSGELPTLRALAERGHVGRLETLKPTLSPRIWTTLATGKLPEKHGIEGFVVERPGEEPRKVTSLDRKTKALWNVLTDAGVESDTIGWWSTWPAEPVLGRMVAQTNTIEGMEKGALVEDAPAQVFPPAAEAGVLDVLRSMDARLPALREEIFGLFSEDLTPGMRRRLEDCDWALRADATYLEVLAERVRARGPAPVTALYLGGTDVVGHRFWAAYDPEPFAFDQDSFEVTRFGHLVPSYYAYADRVLGELFALFPADTTIVVVSDHGMSALRSVARSNLAETDVDRFTGGHTLADPGALIAAGPLLRAPDRKIVLKGLRAKAIPVLGRMQDVCPTLLALLGLPVGEDMDGVPLEALVPDARLADLRTVPTHDDPAWFAARPEPFDVAEDPERLNQLEDLGYLGD